MIGKREARKMQTRAAILDAALHLFGRQGYENTSIDQLARAAGIGKGTIYSYFKSKSEIFLGFCEEQLSYVYGELTEKSGQDTPLIDRLLTLFMGEFRFVSRNREFGRILMRETVFPKDLTVDRSGPLDRKYIDILVPMFHRAQKRDELRTDLELTLVVGHFYALYIMTVGAWYMGRLLTEEDVAMAMESLFQQAMDGLAPAENRGDGCHE
ncbi:MAG TPA: TetR/AcrR family transcriptional regulator [Desulfobacteraceae bacterium]|nr:TetR/AcrR family transcriptional regulator [Desulfobacteraceae bacterium]